MDKKNLSKKVDYRIQRFYEDKNIKNCFNGIKKDLRESVKSINKRLKEIEKKDSPAWKPLYDAMRRLIKSEFGAESK